MNSLSRVQLLETAWTAAYQAPSSMGFSRREYWSGVPLPSPAHHSTLLLIIYFRLCTCYIVSIMSDSLRPYGPLPIKSSLCRFSRQEYWSGLPWSPPGDLPNPGIEPTLPASPVLPEYSLPTESPGLSHECLKPLYS